MTAAAAPLIDTDIRRALVNMANTYATLVAAVPAPGAPTPVPTPAPGAPAVVATVRNEAAKPPPYDGNRAGYGSFRRNMVLHPVGVPGGDTHKSSPGLSFMTMGDADRWARSYFDLHQAAIDASPCVWCEFL